jgi:hypothetical protein
LKPKSAAWRVKKLSTVVPDRLSVRRDQPVVDRAAAAGGAEEVDGGIGIFGAGLGREDAGIALEPGGARRHAVVDLGPSAQAADVAESFVEYFDACCLRGRGADAASETAAAANKLLTGFIESPFMEASRMVNRSRWLIDEAMLNSSYDRDDNRH